MVQVVAWLWEWGAIGLWAGEWADGWVDGWVRGRCSRRGGRLAVDGGGCCASVGATARAEMGARAMAFAWDSGTLYVMFWTRLGLQISRTMRARKF